MTPPQVPQHKPFVPESVQMKEFTLRAVLLGLVMSVVLGAANAYLGLRAGQTIAATYPAAVIGMAKVQGKEYAETGITVNAIAPAVIRTEMVAALPDAQVKYMTDKIPMKRCGTLDEIAHMAAFIVSRETAFTTGFTFDMTGGRATY